MRATVVACYFRQGNRGEFFWRGMRDNAADIEQIIIVNDEPWTEAEAAACQALAPDDMDIVYLDHEHVGHGVATCFNQAAREASTDYIYFMPFDIYLPAGTINAIMSLARPNKMVIGATHTIGDDTLPTDLPCPRILRRDYLEKHIGVLRANRRQWMYGRNGHTLIHRETLLEMGGFNEEFVALGYGLEDVDFAARFQARFGDYSVVWGPTHSYHFGGDTAGWEDRPQKVPSMASYAVLVRSLAPLYGHRYRLFSELTKDTSPDTINVAHAQGGINASIDVILNCHDLKWLDDASAAAIETRLPNPYMREAWWPKLHIPRCMSKIRPGGTLFVRGTIEPKQLTKLRAEYDFNIDETDGGYEVSVEEDDV